MNPIIPEDTRKEYEKPLIEHVQLEPAQAVLGGCKTIDALPSCLDEWNNILPGAVS